jgi:type I restriction enzyme M protein
VPNTTAVKETLGRFLRWRIEFRPSIVGDHVDAGCVCEELLERFAFCPGRKSGGVYTPRQVSRLLARLLKPKKGDTICDPVCGSGSLLSVVGRSADDLDFSLYGQDRDALCYSICRANLFLQGVYPSSIKLGDTIREPLLLEGDCLRRFDIVVGHLPASKDNWGREVARCDPFHRFDRGVPPRSKGEYAFILHMIRSAQAETGRVGVVVPHCALFRGATEGEIRRRLIEDNLLEAVIGLPAKLMAGSGAPVAILLFNLAKCHRDILIVDASKEFAVGRYRNCLEDEHIERIVSTYCEFDSIAGFSRRVTMIEIAENEFSLDIFRYVRSNEVEEPVDSRFLGKKLEQLEGELAEVRGQMSQRLQELCG